MRQAMFLIFLLFAQVSTASSVKAISYDKDIEPGDLVWFQKEVNLLQLRPGDRLRIQLSSLGGSHAESVAIHAFFRWLSDKGVKIETELEENSICASACVSLFSGGDVRLAHPTANFMFHSPRVHPDFRQIVIGEYLQFLERADKSFADYIRQTKIAEFGTTYLSAKEIETIAKNYLELTE